MTNTNQFRPRVVKEGPRQYALYYGVERIERGHISRVRALVSAREWERNMLNDAVEKAEHRAGWYA